MDPLESYYVRFRRRFYQDATPWARDNIFWGIVVLVIPPLVTYMRDRHAELDLVLIKTTLVLYGFAFAIYALVHACLIPKKLDQLRNAREETLCRDADNREMALKRTITDRDQIIQQQAETIHAATERPKRSAAEQHDYDTAKKALRLLKGRGLTAMRHIRSQGSLTFGVYSPVLPSGLSLNDTLWVYRHCASEGLLTCKSNLGNSEQTFAVAPKMEKILDELLFDDPDVSQA